MYRRFGGKAIIIIITEDGNLWSQRNENSKSHYRSSHFLLRRVYGFHFDKTGNVFITLRRICATTVAVEKQ